MAHAVMKSTRTKIAYINYTQYIYIYIYKAFLIEIDDFD